MALVRTEFQIDHRIIRSEQKDPDMNLALDRLHGEGHSGTGHWQGDSTATGSSQDADEAGCLAVVFLFNR